MLHGNACVLSRQTDDHLVKACSLRVAAMSGPAADSLRLNLAYVVQEDIVGAFEIASGVGKSNSADSLTSAPKRTQLIRCARRRPQLAGHQARSFAAASDRIRLHTLR